MDSNDLKKLLEENSNFQNKIIELKKENHNLREELQTLQGKLYIYENKINNKGDRREIINRILNNEYD